VSSSDAVVWVADGEVADGLDWGTRLVERLEDHGLRVLRRDLTAAGGPVPPARLHVLSGGATTARRATGWMAGGLALTRELVDGARAARHAVMGVCLGAQMIGEALWPGSVRGRERILVGLHEIDWNGGSSARLAVPSFHYEALDRSRVIAGGGRVVGASPQEPVQGFSYGSQVCGVQFHPELTPDDMRRLVHHHRRTIERYGGDVHAALGSVDRHASRWTAGAFATVLSEVVAPGRSP
jgi:GMP synthase-like glutamine amidotransferase